MELHVFSLTLNKLSFGSDKITFLVWGILYTTCPLICLLPLFQDNDLMTDNLVHHPHLIESRLKIKCLKIKFSTHYSVAALYKIYPDEEIHICRPFITDFTDQSIDFDH